MIELKKNDYCIAEVANRDSDGKDKGPKKMVLMKVTGHSKDGLEVIGRVEHLPHIKEVTVTPRTKDVVLRLGKYPKPGKVYGFDLGSLLIGSKEHPTFGELHFFTNPDEKSVDSLWNALDNVSEKLKKNGLLKVFELPCVYEVTPKHGKYAGKYIHPANIEKSPGRIQISVGEDVLENASIGNYTYVLAHEIGHLVHFQCLAEYPKLNAQWVELFSSTIGPRVVDSERCMELGKTVMSNVELGLKGFFSESDEDTKAELKLILKWIKEVKGITSKELDLLLQAETKSATKAFKAAWPVVDVVSKSLQPIITEYATQNFRETFAEAFAFYLCGKKLPEHVKELTEKSLSLIRNHLKSID